MIGIIFKSVLVSVELDIVKFYVHSEFMRRV